MIVDSIPLLDTGVLPEPVRAAIVGATILTEFSIPVLLLVRRTPDGGDRTGLDVPRRRGPGGAVAHLADEVLSVTRVDGVDDGGEVAAIVGEHVPAGEGPACAGTTP